MTAPTITIRSEEANRREVRIEMQNTAMVAEIYSVVFYTFNGAWQNSVAVQRDRKNGKKAWAELNPQAHRHQVARVLDIVKHAGAHPA